MIRTLLKRIIRAGVGLPLILAVVAVTVPLSGCGLRQPPNAARASTPIAPRFPSGSEKFAKATDGLEEALQSASRGFAKGSIDTTALAEIRSFAGQLTRLDSGVRADFAKARTILKKIDSPEKDAIQKRVERQYEQRSQTLRQKLNAIEQARWSQETSAAVADLSAWLDEIEPDPPAQPLGTQLPHRIVDYKAGPPILGTAIAPAYAPNTPGAIPSTLPVEPTPEDLAETFEVQFSPEIRSLATSLGNDPVRMYEWVRNNIDFEPYGGSMKGANGTLRQRAGNDADTASLLVALYRVSGIPARYVRGVIDVPVDSAVNWLGVGTPDAAARLLTAGGIQAQQIYASRRVEALRMQHTWVEAAVSLSDYRGVGALRARQWIPLDPSYKMYAEDEDVRLLDGLAERVALDATDTVNMRLQLAQLAEHAEEWASSHRDSAENSLRTRRISTANLRLLPSSLPFTAYVAAEETQCSDGSWVRITLPGARPTTIPLSDAISSNVSISYTPAERTTVDLIDRFGSTLAVPAYLAQMIPILTVDGSLLATGSAGSLAERQYVNVELLSSSMGEVPLGRDLTVGSYYGLTFDYGTMPGDRLRRTAEDSARAAEAARSGEVDVEELAGGFLATVGQMYFAQLDTAANMVSSATQVRHTKGPSMLFASTDVAPVSVLGIPASAGLAGSALDVRLNAYSAVSRRDLAVDVARFNILTGFVGSMLESDVYSQLLGVDAVSTADVFSEAANQGVEILRIDADTSNEMRLRLESEYGSEFAALADQRVESGLTVFVPSRPISVDGWTGYAWLEQDPVTGASAYMIEDVHGAICRAVQKWWSTGVGATIDLTRMSYLWSEFRPVWQKRVSGLFTTYEKMPPKWLNGFLDVLSVVVMPLVYAFEQYMGDLNDPTLTGSARAERALMTWIVFAAEATAVTALVMPITMSLGNMAGQYGGVILSSIVAAAIGVAVSILWDRVKEVVYDYYGAGSEQAVGKFRRDVACSLVRSVWA